MRKQDWTPIVVVLLTVALAIGGIAVYRVVLRPTTLSAQSEPLTIPLSVQWQPAGFVPSQFVVQADEPVTYTLFYDIRYRQSSTWYTDTLQSDCTPRWDAPPEEGQCGATITATLPAITEEVWVRLRWQPVTDTVPIVYGIQLPPDCDVPDGLCELDTLEPNGSLALNVQCREFLEETCLTRRDQNGYWLLYYVAAEEPYCGTPYPTATPYPPQPTYTPRPTPTPCIVQPTYTPNPTYTPLPTATDYP